MLLSAIGNLTFYNCNTNYEPEKRICNVHLRNIGRFRFHHTGSDVYSLFDEKANDDVYVPVPEVRTPVIPVSEEPKITTTLAVHTEEHTQTVAATEIYHENEIQNIVGTDNTANSVIAATDTDNEMITETRSPDEIISSHQTAVFSDTENPDIIAQDSTTQTTTTTAETNTEPTKEQKSQLFLLNGLRFYESPDNERKK